MWVSFLLNETATVSPLPGSNIQHSPRNTRSRMLSPTLYHLLHRFPPHRLPSPPAQTRTSLEESHVLETRAPGCDCELASSRSTYEFDCSCKTGICLFTPFFFSKKTSKETVFLSSGQSKLRVHGKSHCKLPVRMPPRRPYKTVRGYMYTLSNLE